MMALGLFMAGGRGFAAFNRRAERGVALITVIVVLLALVIIATPFSISMRNHSEASTDLLNRTRALKECEALRNIALEKLKETHEAIDSLTPYYDDASEWDVPFEDIPFGFDVSNPRGKIWSLRSHDLQGRVNLNGASVFLVANLLNQRTQLMEPLQPESISAKVSGVDGFPEAGILWIEGEGLLYTSRSDDSFEELDREIELPTLENNIRAIHSAGAEAVGYPAFLIATYCYKWITGEISLFPTIESVRNIAIFGEESLARSKLESIRELVTVRSGFPGGYRFVNPQRILGFGTGDSRDALIVGCARYIAPGSVVRVSCGEDIHISMVVRSKPLDDRSWSLLLQEPMPFETEGGETGTLDVLARHPVNINTAPVEVIEALITGLSLTDLGEEWVESFTMEDEADRAGEEGGYLSGLLESMTGATTAGGGGSSSIRSKDACAVAKAIAAEPVKSFQDLNSRLASLTEADQAVLSENQRWAIMLNALNSNDAFVHCGTAPFCFTSEGCFSIDTAVSNNYEGSGREKAHQFMRDLACVAPSGPLLAVFSNQKDFESQRRLTREGRHYITFPENLHRPEAGNSPPSSAPSILIGNKAPSEDRKKSGLQLAPALVDAARTLHFDATDRPYFNEGSVALLPPTRDSGFSPVFEYPLGFRTGENLLVLEPSEDPASILGGAYARVYPFSIEFWYRFDDIKGEHLIFDCGLEGREENNRIYLFYDGKKLRFRVSDVMIPTSTLNSDDPIEHAEISYDFHDLPLQEGVFYHIACMTSGTLPSDLCMFIDGVPRGKRSFQTRLSGPLASAAQSGGVGVQSSSDTLSVKDSTSFPHRGVVRIGQEIIEYTSRSNDEFIVDSSDFDPFGGRGRRGTVPPDHEETETVELYGYTCALRSEIIPKGDMQLGDALGRFWVAIVDEEGGGLKTKDIEVAPPPEIGAYKPRRAGSGFYTDSEATTLPLKNMDDTALGEEGMNAFSAGGGYAVVFTEFGTKFSIRFLNDNQGQKDQDYSILAGDEWRPLTPTGFFVNGFTVMKYKSFNGSTLEGVSWGCSGGYPEGQPKGFMKGEAEGDGEGGGTEPGLGSGDDTGGTGFLAKRCFVTKYEQGFYSQNSGNNNNSEEVVDFEEARVFVVPISIKLNSGAGSLFESFYSFPNNPGEPRPEMIQIGIDFNGTGKDETEWVRYDSVEGDMFCREHPKAIRLIGNWLYPKPLNKINLESPLENDTTSDLINREIDFRAQHGTRHSSHSAGSQVLPVFQASITSTARPGRHDNITLVPYDEEGSEPEAAVINFCNCNGSPEGGPYTDPYHGFCAMIGLRSGVMGDYVRQDFDYSQLRDDIASGSIGDALSTAWAIESRDMTRIVKFPSGELPDKIPDMFVIGGDLFLAPSPSPGCIDEWTFKPFKTPCPGSTEIPSFARFVLARELEADEDDELELFDNALRFNRQMLRHDLLEPFEILKSLPEDAGLLLIGDEIIAYTDVDWEEGVITFAPEGRGLFGTEPGYHAVWEPVVLLNFPELSILDASLDEDGCDLFLKDTSGFPFEGMVLIDEEVVGYTRNEEGLLTMPCVSSGFHSRHGLLRGRYGTGRLLHTAGALVYSLPYRYPDLYTPGANPPEAAYFPFSISAPGGYYSRVHWVEELQGDGADLAVLVRVGGRGDWAAAPSESEDIFLFEEVDTPDRMNSVLRQGRRIDLRVYTRYHEGAFDPLDFASNRWKYSPVLKTMAVEYVQPTRIMRHEEWQ